MAVLALQFGSGILPLLAIFPMIIVGHGAHEAVHSTLVPCKLQNGIVNKLSQWVGFAILGQNFLLMQWSHRQHHKSGRRRPEDTIEQAPYIYGRSGTLSYYCLLLGAAAIYYELAGYIYPVAGSKYHILSRQFRPKYYRNSEYLFGQATVLLFNIALYAIGGWKFVVVKVVFLAYWGMGQKCCSLWPSSSRFMARPNRCKDVSRPHVARSVGFSRGFLPLGTPSVPVDPRPPTLPRASCEAGANSTWIGLHLRGSVAGKLCV